MTINTIVTIAIIIIALVTIGAVTYLYIRDKTLEDIRADVYQLFLEAEHTYRHTESGKQKMSYVIQRARSLLPNWAQLFITESLLEKVVQMWFDAVKDLLDDGKINKSEREEK